MPPRQPAQENATHQIRPDEGVPASPGWRQLKPLARAIAVMLAAGGLAAPAHAQRAFSSAWFAGKGVVHDQALRTGLLPNGQPASSLTNPQGTRPAGNAALERSLGNLNAAARTIAAQQAAQLAARQAAVDAASDTPDGLVPGGLVVDTNSLTKGWLNANAPTQGAADGKTVVGIQQTAEKAILNWETFNVGKHTTVQFDQKGGAKADGTNSYIAFNRVNDPSGKPSEIAGQIKAGGAVYIVNRNGIIFNGSSQVNTRSLVASSLALSDAQFNAGINNPQRMSNQGNDFPIPQFGAFSSEQPFIYGAGGFVPGVNGQPDQLGLVNRFDPGAAPGPVSVQAGAQLDVNSGGKLMLFAPRVSNAGRLSAPDGQVILAAGENIYLKSPTIDDLNPVRGLDVAASAVPGWAFTGGQLMGAMNLSPVYADAQFVAGIRNVVLPEMAARARAVGYEVVNSGTVESARGNITLQAQDVRQDGVLSSSTALNNRNGSILLRAWGLGMQYYADGVDALRTWSAGTLALGPGSITLVMPDTADTTEIEATALATRYQPGRVAMYGQLIDVRPHAGVLVPAGQITLDSAVNPLLAHVPDKPGSTDNSSRIYLDSDSFLSVAGLRDMRVDMSRNFITAELRINELRDSPLLVDSWLRGQKVVIDRRAGGIFTDGPMAGVQWVTGPDGKTFIPGAWVGTPLADVAGWVGVGKTDLAELSTDAGSIRIRAGGDFITRQGSLLDVSGGSVRYTDGLNTSTKLMGADGRIYTMDKALPDMDYTGIAGRYARNHERWGVSEEFASSVIGRDTMEGGYTEGRKAGSVQILAGKSMVLEGSYAGAVVVGDRQQKQPSKGQGGRLDFGGGSVEDRPWSLGELIISHDAHRLAAGFGSGSMLGQDFVAAPRPGRNETPGKLTYLLDDTLSESGMGAVNFNLLRDFTLEENATLQMAAGTSVGIGQFENSTNRLTINGRIVAPGGQIGVAAAMGTLQIGQHGRLDTAGEWVNTWLDGQLPARWAMNGGSLLLSAKTFEVDSRAVLDVSGGGRVDAGGKGLPRLRAGNAGSVSLSGVGALTDLGALDLRAWSAGSAGSLGIVTEAPVHIGGGRAEAIAAGALWLPEGLYAERGFGQFSIAINNGINPQNPGAIVIANGAQIRQLASSLDLSGFDYRLLASGQRLAGAAPVAIRPLQDRLAFTPSSLLLSSSGDIEVGAGALAATDTGGRIELRSDKGQIVVRGTLDAPAGSITLAGRNIALESGASLLARGVPVVYTDGSGRRVGRVLDGGSVTVDASGGVLALQAGSLIDVSGASAVVDGVATGLIRGAAPDRRLASNGGAITIAGSGLMESSLVARAGGAGARGGRLSFELDAPAAEGGTPQDQLKRGLVDPDCYFPGAVDGICDYSEGWRQALDFDWAPGYIEYGYEVNGPRVLTSALMAQLAEIRELVLSDKLAAPGTRAPLDAAAFGLSADALDFFRDNFFYDETLRNVLQSPGQAYALTVRPGGFAGGGFADLALTGTTRLDHVDLALARSITVTGDLTGHAGSSSSLRAPHIVLNGAPQLSPQTPPPVRADAGGQLLVAAGLLDLALNQSTRISGYRTTQLEGGEIRMGAAMPEVEGPDARYRVYIDVDGDLVLRAGQVYPSSATTAVVRAGDAIRVERLGSEAGAPPLSAGGTLRLEAPVIGQNGVLRAPFGQIELLASERLTLGAGSITSVSGAGLVVPYGTLVNNEHWHDPLLAVDATAPGNGSLVAPPEKRISLKSPDVVLGKGAVVDISGGGDLYAWEFVPGPGGSHDVLKVPGMYAILPGYSASAPLDGNTGGGTGGSPGASGASGSGQRIWLAGGPGLPAGWYTLLPARYALLPGAFAVQGNGAQWSVPGAKPVAVADGSVVMQGRMGDAHGGAQDAEPSAWRVMSGATLRKYTEYNEALANDFFSSEAFRLTQYRLNGQNIVTPRLPGDGGAVVFDATRSLVLDGTLRSAPDKGGRGGLVDIAGQKIAIVGAAQDSAGLQADGYLVIDAASLSNFGAGSLLVGGKRQGNALGLSLDVTATDVIVRNGAGSELYGSEIILAASGQVGIEAGSVITTRGTAGASSGKLVVKPRVTAVYTDPDGQLDDNFDGVIDARDAADDVLTTPSRDYGALVRLSAGGATSVVRENVDTTTGGLVRIGAGATLAGGMSLLIDATGNTELAGSARISASDLSVASGRISFGGGTGGMVLDTASLARLSDSSQLTLRSYSGFDFYSSIDLGAAGLRSLTFDGAVFRGIGDGAINVRGETVSLVNSGGSAPAGQNPAPGSRPLGSLSIDAATLVLGEGHKDFSGLGSVLLSGSTQIIGAGNGTLDAGVAMLALRTPLLTGRGGAAQAITTTASLQVLAAPVADSTGLQDSLGTRLSLRGSSIQFDGRAVALGGSIDMTATAGSVVVGEHALVDVGGFARQFFDVSDYADAGRITLASLGGDVNLQAGSRLNLAAHAGGGSAGTLSLAASGGGTVVLDGAIAAQAGAGGRAGSFTLDIAALPDFAAFSERLNDAGFNRSRQFRIRQGDVVLGGLTTVEDFGLVADQGSINITGTIDARSAFGGAIRITGADGVAMQQGAQLLAGATGAFGSGRVTLEAAGGQLNLKGGLVDVAGNEGGKVRLRARQNAAHDDLDATAVNVRIAGARSAVLEGVSSYNVADYDGATVDSVKADAMAHAAQFAAASGAIQNRLGTSVAVMPGITISSAGDLALNSDWNLFTDFTDLAGQREGTLTLRAGGKLAINGNLSDGFDQAGRAGTLQQGASWNLRLLAGADLDSADMLALKPPAALAAGQGSITIGKANTSTGTDADNGAGWLVRTGTGDLEVRAGGDVTLAHRDSVIYTAGRKDLSTWSDFTTASLNATYGIEGGNLDIAAQGSISAAPSNQRYTEWLNRQGNVNAQFVFGEYSASEYGVRPDGSYGPILRAAEQSSWWINYGEFRQGVAALGGGNVKVTAGGDLTDLGVSLATNLRLRGGRTTGEATTSEMRNGGALTVDAGGAIRGGQYYVARGAGDIRANETAAGRSITVRTDDNNGNVTTQVFPLAPVLALGDATLKLRTAGDLKLQSVIDPLLVRYGDTFTESGRLFDHGAFMSGYTDRSALDLSSTGGDITLVNQGAYIFRDLLFSNNTREDNGLGGKSANRYPALTHVTAMNGSLDIQGPAYLMPGTTSDLRLLAREDIRFDNVSGIRYPNQARAEIVMAYATPSMMPSAQAPVGGDGFDHQVNLDALLHNIQGITDIGATQKNYYASLRNPGVLALAGDYQPSRIYAAQGSITGMDLTASEQTWTRAGTDIRGLYLRARNVHASDTTLLEAGNDILAMAPLQGRRSAELLIEGAGSLVLSAGRDVYADQLEVQSLGNQLYDLNNRPIADTQVRGLPAQGASITVMAGINAAAGYDAFAGAYLDPSKVAAMPDYLKARAADGSVLPIYLTDGVETRRNGADKTVRRGLVSYMKDMTGETLAPLDAWVRFRELPQLAQQQFIRQVYMLELRDGGRDQNEPGVAGLPLNGGFNRGYAAISALFPGDSWKGDVAANKLMLRTMSGGDVSVLTPGGSLQVAALGTTVPDGYGLVTLASGHISVFAKDDVVVNRSRILSFVPEASARGSDQIIWSSDGDIDAGRGSKTVRVPSAPEVLTDVDANTTVREKSDMSGSGIGTVGDGDVDLLAPKGTVNAGDAGVRVAGNLNIAALHVLNADNIEVEGEIKGLPVIAAVNIGALTNASAAASQAAVAAQDVLQRERSAARQNLPSVFTVRVLGFGNEPMEAAPPARGAAAPANTALQVSYDTGSSFQVLGRGRLDPAQRARLTEAEQRRLAE
ncbi:MAG: filamentous hemagglutinin N-terminal domain-containing protein [Variovorax sp.]|nr:MAG: filamentous hemagglutinin N-terminal domain-containing protein [Variovorax sp.]